MVLSTFQSQTKLQKCFLLNIIELGGLKIAINNAMPISTYIDLLQIGKLRIKWKRKIQNTCGIFLLWIS